MNADCSNVVNSASSPLVELISDQSGSSTSNNNVINDQVTVLTPVPPESPLTSQSKYNWDPSVQNAVLPVRCRNIGGELHKAKFGSGGRGRCIRVGNEWFTPSEFEAKCGRGSSKDWKRSIRYAGRTLQCLIEENILQPHAASCTCTACCDDEAVTGPVRLFVPYKRRKRESNDSKLNEDLSPSPQIDTSGVVILTPTTPSVPTPRDTIQVVTADGTIVGTAGPDTPVITLNTPQLKPLHFNFNEEKQWWQLEEAVNNLISCGNQLKCLIEQLKEQSKKSREAVLSQQRIQFDKQKVIINDNIDTLHNEVDFKRCANCNREAFSECTGCHSVSYCSSFCQQKDWINHHSECGAASVVLLQEIEVTEKTLS